MKQTNPAPRQDILALWGGILFSFLFTAFIWWAGSGIKTPLLPDQGPTWYYWQLPNPTFWTRASGWGLYLIHQIANWGMIYYAQTHIKKYTSGLHRINIIALAVNALFIFLHFVQTRIWYDGLAQDTSIYSSQGSVIVLLVWVLLMENNRRGLFFGKRAPISQEVIAAAKKYHGYFFSWAIVFTFWYHPMENTAGHLIGFLYMFLLMLQGSLFFTRIHVNRWWTLVQEVTVLFHGTLVAIGQAGLTGFWPMFFFGFLSIFIVTQMHGLGLSRMVRWLLAAGYVVAVLGVYNWRGWEKLDEIIRIPVIDYLLVFIMAGLFWLILWTIGKLSKATQTSSEAMVG